MAIVAENFILETMKDFEFYGSDILFNHGHPIMDSQKLQIARIAFGIPDAQPVYFAVTADGFGKFKENSKGFAIASHGLYLNANGKNKVLVSFEKFYDWEVSKLFSYVKIGGYEFNVGFPGKIAKLLEYMQFDIGDLLKSR